MSECLVIDRDRLLGEKLQQTSRTHHIGRALFIFDIPFVFDHIPKSLRLVQKYVMTLSDTYPMTRLISRSSAKGGTSLSSRGMQASVHSLGFAPVQWCRGKPCLQCGRNSTSPQTQNTNGKEGGEPRYSAFRFS